LPVNAPSRPGGTQGFLELLKGATRSNPSPRIDVRLFFSPSDNSGVAKSGGEYAGSDDSCLEPDG